MQVLGSDYCPARKKHFRICGCNELLERCQRRAQGHARVLKRLVLNKGILTLLKYLILVILLYIVYHVVYCVLAFLCCSSALCRFLCCILFIILYIVYWHSHAAQVSSLTTSLDY